MENWNLAHRQNVSFRTSPLKWCGNLHRIPGSSSSSIRRGGHWPPAKTYRIPACIHVVWYLFAERNTNRSPFPAGRSMSAPTRYDVYDLEFRWRLPHQSEDWFAMTGISINYSLTNRVFRHIRTKRNNPWPVIFRSNRQGLFLFVLII